MLWICQARLQTQLLRLNSFWLKKVLRLTQLTNKVAYPFITLSSRSKTGKMRLKLTQSRLLVPCAVSQVLRLKSLTSGRKLHCTTLHREALPSALCTFCKEEPILKLRIFIVTRHSVFHCWTNTSTLPSFWFKRTQTYVSLFLMSSQGVSRSNGRMNLKARKIYKWRTQTVKKILITKER